MTVAELGRRMSSAEFSEWLAFSGLEPFGPAREDERAGVVASLMANAYRDRHVRPEPFGWQDFFPERAAEAAVDVPAPSPDDLLTKVKSIFAGLPRKKRSD